MRGRGLKPVGGTGETCGIIVAPHAGAWIETFGATLKGRDPNRRPSCGGVD